MVSIQLEYQPFRFLKYQRKINGCFPSAFSELNSKQLITIARLISQTISDTDFLQVMTGIKKSGINKLDDYQRLELMRLFEPFTSITPYNQFIIPSIKIGTKVLVSPKPVLKGMTFGQFVFAESYFVNYQTDKKPLDLYKFVASLYLPEFHKFNEDEIGASELYLGKVKNEILEAVVINYVLIKEWLSHVYPLIFTREEELDENYEPKKQSLKNPNANSAWLKIFESIVGDDLVNHERYAVLPLHNVLRWMTDKIKQNLKHK